MFISWTGVEWVSNSKVVLCKIVKSIGQILVKRKLWGNFKGGKSLREPPSLENKRKWSSIQTQSPQELLIPHSALPAPFFIPVALRAEVINDELIPPAHLSKLYIYIDNFIAVPRPPTWSNFFSILIRPKYIDRTNFIVGFGLYSLLLQEHLNSKIIEK